MIEVSSVVVFAGDVESTIAFYRAAGVDFETEDHGDGDLHAATDLGDIHFAVLPSTEQSPVPATWKRKGSTFIGFYVESLDDTAASLGKLGARILVDHQICEWGCRFVVEDPDGRAVEINQRNHCTDGTSD